ncbi:M1 family aminopeptidase [Sphingomonas sp. LHG3406-1]|uniref:ABC transporter permease/M1 family aminopeptidase n=1 Tax=Sphingomonas sp. LHG3406-1 TaxID=2804617 RepID=UPI00260F0B3C|nr:M1 family aminopeptidase [Sphingomonas sp. LHG3406-1]
MFLGITRFEIRYQLRNPVFWVAVAVFFLLGFGLTASANVSIGTPGAVKENAPYAIGVALGVFSFFYLFVITAFVANAIVRDESSGFAPIVRATPVTKVQIVLGRFLGGLTVAWLGYLALPLGMIVGTLMPWVDPETIGPFRPGHYAWYYLILAIPNIFLLSAILFATATALRSMLASYIAAVLVVMGYLIASGVAGQKLELRELFARWEPLGTAAFGYTSQYWTQAEMNSRLIEFSGVIAFNRIWAILLGTAFLGLALWRFSMSERAPSRRRLKKLARREAREAKAAAAVPTLGGDAVVARSMEPSRAAQFVMRLRVEVRQVLTSPGLIILCLLAFGFTAANLWQGGSTYGTSDFPTATNVIDTVRGMSSIFLLMVAVFYGGELVWRERDRKFNELIDSSPVPSWVMTVPKIVAIFLVLAIVNSAAMIAGLTYQLFEGAREFGIVGYLAWFILPSSIDALLIAILAVVAQVLSPNKYVGWGIIFLWFVGSIFLNNLGFANPLYIYAGSPAVPLSDFAGAGSFWRGQAVLQFYWLMCALILCVIAHLLWPRGTDLGLRTRLKRLRRPGSKAPYAIAGAAALAMVGTGAYAYHNIKVLNRYQTSDEIEAWRAEYERKYLKYEKLPQPSVAKVTLDVQLHPAERRMVTDGRYQLVNRTGAPLSDVHVRTTDLDVRFAKLDIDGARLVSNDEKFGYRIYRFDRPLAPGATSDLLFRSEVWRRGFRAGSPSTDLIENGTFVNNGVFAPVIGMDRDQLLGDRTQRRRQGLPAELRPARLEDMSATRRNYAGADWVMSDIRLTTDAGQRPMAPGNLVSDTTANGRRTARFVSPAPILNFFSIQSADYRTAAKSHDGVLLSVLHHPSHDFNVSKMLRAMEVSLDYYRENFGPYQFNYARIIEFPGYQSFAQAFAGTMPYSESIGFNANTNDPEKIDFTTYVVAHEVAHQYWAHQVIGADQQGGTLTSETLAQYSALMVMRKIYGPDKIRRFLKYELDRYLAGRKGEAVEEQPLLRVENQQYLHYRKGAVAMYLLQERLGEDAVNRALSRFVARFRFAGPPYLRSTDLMTEFRREARTPEQQQLITDLFERITLYDLKVIDATTRKVGNGWETKLTVAGEKFVADGKGAERPEPLAEPIEIGLFTARPGIGAYDARNVLVMERRPLKNGSQTLVMRTAAKPTFAGIDPYNFFIDRNSDDNVKDVTGS